VCCCGGGVRGWLGGGATGSSRCRCGSLWVVLLLGLALPDLGPVLSPLGSAACRLAVLGLQNFPLGPQNGRHVRSSRHVLIERKAKSSAGGLHVLLIIMWPDTTLAMLLLLV
jgi:hypothetical protein